MRITVLGASGQVGQWVVRIARDRGFAVRAVYRSEPDEVPGGIEVAIEPDLLDAGALKRVCGDADAVSSAVGHRRTQPRNPWSRLLSPPDLCLRLAKCLDAALADRPVRLLLVSAAGVGDSRERMSPILRFVFDHSKIGLGYRDLAEMEDYLRQTGRPCVVLRPTTLTNRARTGCEVVERYRLWSRIPRKAVADYLVDLAARDDVTGFRAEMVSGR